MVLILNLNYIKIYIVMNALSFRVNWPWMASALTYPISLLFVVFVLSRGHLIDFALVGGVISAVAISGITALDYITWLKLDSGYQNLIMTTKTSKMDYMIAHLAGELTWITPSFALFFILDLIFGLLTPYTFLALLFLVALVSISTYSIGFWFSGIIKYSRHASPLGVILALAMITISPTFYPYTYLPKAVLYVLSIFPTTPAVVLAQGIFGLAPMQWYMLPLLIVETCVYFVVAVKFTKWRQE